MRKIKMLSVGIFAVVSLLVLCRVYLAFAGNPRQHIHCEKLARTYLQETYPFLHIAKLQSRFNWKMGTYGVSVTADAPAPVSFLLRYDSTGELMSENYRERKLARDLSEELTPILKQAIPEIETVRVTVYLYPDRVYENNIVFHRDLNVDNRVWVRVMSDAMSKQTCATVSLNILQEIKTTGIHARYVFINCRGNDLPSQFTVIIEPEKVVTHASIVEHMTEELIND